MKQPFINPIQFTTLLIFGYFLIPSPLHSNLLLIQQNENAQAASPVILDFDSAVSHTMASSLSLSIAENEIQIRQGEIKQAKLYSNPTFNYELETSELGWKDRQELYALSQLIELGGKRQKLVKVASNEYYAAMYGYEATKLERLYQLTKWFIQSIAAQELLQVALEEQQNAEEFLKVTQSKFEAGKLSLIETSKASLTKSLADFNIRQKRTAFQTSKKNLSILWSTSAHAFDLVTYPFYEISAPIPLNDYLAKLCDQPEIVRALYKNLAAYHHLKFEKAQRIPDVTLTLGYCYDEGDNGLVAGIAVPLPFWNQNQGNIKKARYEMRKIENEKKQLLLTLEAKLTTAHLELMRSFHEAEEIKSTLLRTATQAFDLSLEGYREGKFDYMDVLEAKRSLFDIREKYIQTLVTYHTRRAEIEFLNSQTN